MIEIPSKKDLVDLLPMFFQNIEEYPEIMKAWAKGLRMVGTDAQQVWDNLYVQTCDLATLEQYESYLKLNPSPGDTIEIRRARVMARLVLSVPYSERKIRSIFDDLFGADAYTLTVDSATSTVSMEFTKHASDGVGQFCSIWYGMAPAHVAFTVNENITTDIEGDMYFGGCVSRSVYTRI